MTVECCPATAHVDGSQLDDDGGPEGPRDARALISGRDCSSVADHSRLTRDLFIPSRRCVVVVVPLTTAVSSMSDCGQPCACLISTSLAPRSLIRRASLNVLFEYFLLTMLHPHVAVF